MWRLNPGGVSRLRMPGLGFYRIFTGGAPGTRVGSRTTGATGSVVDLRANNDLCVGIYTLLS